MANIKISELNDITSVAYNDILPIVDTSADETKKITVEDLTANNVELIAITNIAPAECNIDDKYYNTNTNKIYTAIEINEWETTGEEPIEGIIYVIYETQKIYVYNGTTLIPIGDNGGGIIALKSITTAPSTFSEGDKYYNATDDLIYTATSSSTWDEGTTASAVSLYLNEIDNELYRYYNNAMNLLESGSGGGETLPVGSEIDFDGNVSDIPAGWELVSGVNYTAYELYADATGSNTTLTLSDSAANYTYLEIFFRSNDNVYNSTKVYNPNGKTFLTMGLRPTGSTTASPVYLKAEEFSINGTTITKGNYVEMNFQTNGTFTIATNNVMYITRVVGLKEE